MTPPKALGREELAAIRERNRLTIEQAGDLGVGQGVQDAARLLAHIDAITEAVEGLPSYIRPPYDWPDGRWMDRAAVLAILRGTPQR